MSEPIKRNVQRARTDSRTISARLQPGGRVTLTEFLALITEFVPEGLSFDDVYMGFNYLNWPEAATEEELAKWAAWDAEQVARTEKWERWKLGELIEKYGTPESETNR